MGVGVPKTGEAFLSVNGVSTYDQWEFLYDPRIEQMYAQSGALGGGGNGSGNGLTTTPLTGLGSPNNPGGVPGQGNNGSTNNGAGNTFGNPGSSSGTGTPTPPANPPQ